VRNEAGALNSDGPDGPAGAFGAFGGFNQYLST